MKGSYTLSVNITDCNKQCYDIHKINFMVGKKNINGNYDVAAIRTDLTL